MRKRLALLFAAGAVFASFGAASADPLVCTDGGCVGVADAGHVLILDGAASNPDPFDGYIVVDAGRICASDTGGPYTGGEDAGATCAP